MVSPCSISTSHFSLVLPGGGSLLWLYSMTGVYKASHCCPDPLFELWVEDPVAPRLCWSLPTQLLFEAACWYPQCFQASPSHCLQLSSVDISYCWYLCIAGIPSTTTYHSCPGRCPWEGSTQGPPNLQHSPLCCQAFFDISMEATMTLCLWHCAHVYHQYRYVWGLTSRPKDKLDLHLGREEGRLWEEQGHSLPSGDRCFILYFFFQWHILSMGRNLPFTGCKLNLKLDAYYRFQITLSLFVSFFEKTQMTFLLWS